MQATEDIGQAADSSGLVLVVDDDGDILRLVRRTLERAGYQVETFVDAESCLAALSRTLPEAVCLDLTLPGLGGLDALARIRNLEPFLPVIILTSDSSVDTVVSAMKAGAYDYLVKPLDRTKLRTTVGNAVDRSRMSIRLAQLEREVEGRGHPGILGQSAPMNALFRKMDRLAATDITVLIHGESGTGKELIARALHQQSGRRGFAFVALSCAAIPETLQESELFGHERGSFTGATERRAGQFEQAHRGTLFLDEVAELSLPLQAKLLRVLQERRFYRVGGSIEIESDFRLIAATHRDLSVEVKAGRFREDLYFRIAVFELEVPPLRDRKDDIPLLAARLLADANGGRPIEIDPATLDCLVGHSWPGNVRELSNVIQHALVVSNGLRVVSGDLPPRLTTAGEISDPSPVPTVASKDPPSALAAPSTLEHLERQAIEEALARTQGNVSEVGRQLGIGRTTLYRKLRRYGLR